MELIFREKILALIIILPNLQMAFLQQMSLQWTKFWRKIRSALLIPRIKSFGDFQPSPTIPCPGHRMRSIQLGKYQLMALPTKAASLNIPPSLSSYCYLIRLRNWRHLVAWCMTGVNSGSYSRHHHSGWHGSLLMSIVPQTWHVPSYMLDILYWYEMEKSDSHACRQFQKNIKF